MLAMKKFNQFKTVKEIKNEIRGLELGIKRDQNSKILLRKLEGAKSRLASFANTKEAPPLIYRTVPITSELSGKIAAYCMNNGIQPKQRLFSISRIRVYQILQDAGKKAGIEKGRRHPHVLRHGFAVNAGYDAGAEKQMSDAFWEWIDDPFDGEGISVSLSEQTTTVACAGIREPTGN